METTSEERENYAYLDEMARAKKGPMGMQRMQPRRAGRGMAEEYAAYSQWWAELSDEKQEALAEDTEDTERTPKPGQPSKGPRTKVGWRIQDELLEAFQDHVVDLECSSSDLANEILEQWFKDHG